MHKCPNKQTSKQKGMGNKYTPRFIRLSYDAGCKQSGVYVTECNIPCPAACKNKACHIQNGACLYCEHGIYGINCNMSCPDNCQNNKCHVQNGTCLTCKPGWTGMYCKTSKSNYHIN